ncbi:MAG: sensor histidine kinase, partial [Clostridia bacterium]|nr:sensor histidine kinase [Clostridia bacterium]
NNTTTAIALYILVLTAFYMDAGKVKPRVLLLCLGIPLYFLCFVAHIHFLVGGIIDLFPVIRQSLGAIVAIVLHFIVLHLCVAFYRQYMRLDKALKELDASKKELEKAYEAVAEVTALEERQRIAKDIHDTAGHSITTVIMQTEAAKRILEQDPKEAKQKIVAANLQAKHALDELRDSVHLLSGNSANQTLRSALEDILHESTDGTEIVIRSNVEDIAVSSAKQRFLCNSLKEGISNGLRHGKATAFWFELKEEDGRVCFLLSDNGKGVEKNLKEGFGLSSMRSRAKTLGGEVTFESEEDEGFELKIVL